MAWRMIWVAVASAAVIAILILCRGWSLAPFSFAMAAAKRLLAASLARYVCLSMLK